MKFNITCRYVNFMLVLKALGETGYILGELFLKKEPYILPHEKCISLDDLFYYVHFI